MQIRSHIQKGEGHPVYCEDFLWYEQPDERWLIAAVMDGCSGGRESHFASALMGKLLRKAIRTIWATKSSGWEDMNLSDTGERLMHLIFNGLKTTRDALQLDYTEILATLILCVIDRKSKTSWVLVSGDGYVEINGEITFFDQHNRPDYMAYHLDEGFEVFFNKHTHVMEKKEIEHIGISTDGIGSFFISGSFGKTGLDPVKMLLSHTDTSIHQTIKSLYTDYGLAPYDDLGIVLIQG